MELVRRGNHWEGGYYMNGDRHRFRKDKLKVAKWNNDIWVHEEGGESQSITTWLQNYGGAADFWAAIDILKGCKCPLKFDGVFRKKENKELTVSRDVYDGAMPSVNTPYPFVYLADSQQIDDENKSAIFGNVYQTIHVWHNSPTKRGTISAMIGTLKSLCRQLHYTLSFA